MRFLSIYCIIVSLPPLGPKYRRKIEFDPLEGLPVVSFTCFDREVEERNEPSAAYFETILKGLKETYPGYSESELVKKLNNEAAPVQISIEVLGVSFSVCKVPDYSGVDIEQHGSSI